MDDPIVEAVQTADQLRRLTVAQDARLAEAARTVRQLVAIDVPDNSVGDIFRGFRWAIEWAARLGQTEELIGDIPGAQCPRQAEPKELTKSRVMFQISMLQSELERFDPQPANIAKAE